MECNSKQTIYFSRLAEEKINMDDKTRNIVLVIAVVLIIGVIIFLKNPFENKQPILPQVDQNNTLQNQQPSPYPIAPEIIGIAHWINSEPLTLAELRGKVVLVDFWTYSCINCIRTLPYLKDWHEKYKDLGFVLIGVHSPEFEFEKEIANVEQEVNEKGLSYPIAMDNEMQTWGNYNNRFWPAKYLIDIDGRIRYTHFGEGAYQETEQLIQELLEEKNQAEIDIELNQTLPPENKAGFFRTRELYAGYTFGEYLGNTQAYQSEQTTQFTDEPEHIDGKIYLQGEWFTSAEFVRHARQTQNNEDYIAIKYLATEVNIVAGAAEEPYKIFVTLDGQNVPDSFMGNDVQKDEQGNTYIEVTSDKLYNVITGQLGIHELKLSSNSSGFSLYTFTFGG